MKKVLIVLCALAVLAGAGVFLLLGNLGGLIKGVVERVGSDATQTQVTLAEVNLSLSDGSGELRDLVVGNPTGFKTEHAMALGLIRVQIDTATLQSDPIVIKEIVIEAPQIIFEVGSGGSNIGAIQEAVAAYAAGLGGGESGGDEPQPGDSTGDDGSDGGGTKVVIENLYVRGARVSVSAPFLKGEDVNATVPEIHLKDLGKKENGATAGEVAAKVLDAVSKATIDAVADQKIKGLSKYLGDGDGFLEKAGSGLKSFFGGGDDDE